MTDWSVITASYTFQLTMADPCDFATIDAPKPDKTISYNYITQEDFTMDQFTTTPAACPVTYSCTMLTASADGSLCPLINFDTLTGDFSLTLGPTDYLAGTY